MIRRGGAGRIAESLAGRSSRRPPATPAWAWRRVGLLKGYKLLLVVPDKMAAGEDPAPCAPWGVDVRITRSDVGKGPPRVLPGHGPGDRPPKLEQRRSYINQVLQPGEPQGPRDHHRPGDPGADGRGDVDAVVVGGRLRRDPDRPWAGSFAKASPKTKMVLGRSGWARSWRPWWERGEEVEPGSWGGRGGSARTSSPTTATLALVAKAYEITDQPRASPPARLLLLTKARHPGRVVLGHACWPAAPAPTAASRPSPGGW